jgi:two-component system cell cycle response regulator DivK
MEQPLVMSHIPAYRGDDPYLFVSYAHLDDVAVMQEIEWLNLNGFNVWYDEGISGGSEWREEIALAIKYASHVLFYVSENSIRSAVCIKEVNYALMGDSKMLPIYLAPVELPEGLKMSLSDIQALFKYGDAEPRYHERLMQALSTTNRAPSPTAAPRETAIAVLPFSNTTQDKKLQDFFCHGIAEEIINGLVQSRQIKVIARSTSFKVSVEADDVADIGRILGVTHIVEGSVRMSGNQVRVTAQLVNVDDVSTIWSDSLDREVTDILQVQDEITREILLALDPHLETNYKQQQPIEVDAHNPVLAGMQHQSVKHMDNSAYSILVVDDEELNHDMLSRRLKRQGYQVLLASNGYAALGIVEMEKVDLILLDIMMPGVDGLQVLQGIREKRTESQLPIIMVSALTDSEVMVKALSSGANDYVTKPIDFPVVLARIETQLKNKVSSQQNEEPSPRQQEQAPPVAEGKNVRPHPSITPNLPQVSQDQSSEGEVENSNSGPVTFTAAPIDSKTEVKLKVLVVEDNEMNRDMLTRRLERRGYQVMTANDGEQALVQARSEQPDLILMDLRMPVMDGWAATRALKSDPSTAQIPVIALTAHTMDTDEQKALDAGCDAFESKPVVLPSLLDKMVGLLARSRD